MPKLLQIFIILMLAIQKTHMYDQFDMHKHLSYSILAKCTSLSSYIYSMWSCFQMLISLQCKSYINWGNMTKHRIFWQFLCFMFLCSIIPEIRIYSGNRLNISLSVIWINQMPQHFKLQKFWRLCHIVHCEGNTAKWALSFHFF